MLRRFLAVMLLAMPFTAHADDEFMREFSLNDLILSGAEYWPYHQSLPFNYPDDVLWGFYPKRGVPPPGDTDPNPDTASAQAIACAEQAYRKLESFFQSDNQTLKRVIELGAAQGYTNKFYLWTNDYTDASNPYPDGLRTNRIWFWKRNPPIPGRTPGYWKWESTVTQDGRCLLPQDDQIAAYLAQKLRDLGGE